MIYVPWVERLGIHDHIPHGNPLLNLLAVTLLRKTEGGDSGAVRTRQHRECTTEVPNDFL